MKHFCDYNCYINTTAKSDVQCASMCDVSKHETAGLALENICNFMVQTISQVSLKRQETVTQIVTDI